MTSVKHKIIFGNLGPGWPVLVFWAFRRNRTGMLVRFLFVSLAFVVLLLLLPPSVQTESAYSYCRSAKDIQESSQKAALEIPDKSQLAKRAVYLAREEECSAAVHDANFVTYAIEHLSKKMLENPDANKWVLPFEKPSNEGIMGGSQRERNLRRGFAYPSAAAIDAVKSAFEKHGYAVSYEEDDWTEYKPGFTSPYYVTVENNSPVVA